MMTGDDESGSKPTWSREEDKAFENALVAYPEDLEDRWEKIAADVPGKSVEEIKHHYEMLVDDVKLIESGCFPIPCYNSSSPDGSCDDDGGKKGGGGSGDSDSVHRGKSSAKSDQERRKGIAWTEDEHKLFLLGLDKYGKGDWRSISRNFVVTRTPTQVASHAQKYFIRLNSINKDRRRTSIHDITSVDNGDISVPQPPITGGSSAGSKQPSQATPPPAIGQPVGVAGGPAIGTPVNLPPSTMPHMGYGIGAPVPGQAVPGPLMNGKYPMSHTPSLR